MGAINNQGTQLFIDNLREKNESYLDAKKHAEKEAAKMLSSAINGVMGEIAGKYGTVPSSVYVNIDAYEVLGKRYPTFRLGEVTVEFE